MISVVIRWNFLVTIIITFLLGNCTQHTGSKTDVVFGDSIYLANVSPQPGEKIWKFIEYLKSPLWTRHDWEPKAPGSGQADLSQGITIKRNFPDQQGHLETAYKDLQQFLAAGDITGGNGEYVIETLLSPDLEGEAFRIDIENGGCRIFAGHTDGIRRGIFHLEDEMLRLRGPFLPLGTVEKEPVVHRRISRCFFGPIKRPPAMRDELMDEVDYYPDNYLNRLAHEGVNGLWLTVEFRDLASTKFTPEAGKDAEKRLKKLRQTVEKCLRYGIKIYIFTIEPRAWGNRPPYFQDLQVLDEYPEMGGHKRGDIVYFCPFSTSSQEYLYQVVNTIFSEVPELGGMINISHGERTTTCLSAVYQGDNYEGRINCPRCSDKKPWEILHASLSAMEKGMHDANPEAELISWLYMSHPINPYPDDPFELGDWVYDIPANTPDGVIFQFNFETGVRKKEFGKLLIGGDYFISTPGPSYRFERLANSGRENGTKISAKIQTSNSHEVATAPHIPVPSLLYKKFEGMHRLGVSHTMLGWYFGNDPGLMTKAAGMLSFNPFPDQYEFLHSLASVYWKKEDVARVIEAWKYFAEGFENYPLSCMFQRYGPMHDGPVWPLLLKPVDASLYPTWQIASSSTREPWPPSGDRVGECMGRILTHKEVVELCRRMTNSWDKGIEIFNELEKNYSNDPERILDIGVAKALGIQFRGGYNILNFYLLREKMFRMEGQERMKILNQLINIIKEEIELNKKLIELCEKDSRLGFHSEAEGYKYFPEKIRWRMGELKKVLETDVPVFESLIREDKLLFPEYTGKKPEGAVAHAIYYNGSPWDDNRFDIPDDLQWKQLKHGAENSVSQWAALYDDKDLYVIVSDPENTDQSATMPAISNVTVRLEPRRLWMSENYVFNPGEENQRDNEVRVVKESGKWNIIARIPFEQFRWSDEGLDPVRVDVEVQKEDAGTSSWRPNNPLIRRLSIGSENPADLGWLVFEK